MSAYKKLLPLAFCKLASRACMQQAEVRALKVLKMMTAVVILFGLIVPSQSFAGRDDPAEKQRMIIGIGSRTCEAFQASSTDAQINAGIWALGYVSGQNILSDSDFLQSIDGQRIFTLIDRYCREFPGDRVVNAASQAVATFRREAKEQKLSAIPTV